MQGWYISYIDRDPEVLKRQEALEKMKKKELDDQERHNSLVDRLVKEAQEREKALGPAPEYTGADQLLPLCPPPPSARVLCCCMCVAVREVYRVRWEWAGVEGCGVSPCTVRRGGGTRGMIVRLPARLPPPPPTHTFTLLGPPFPSGLQRSEEETGAVVKFAIGGLNKKKRPLPMGVGGLGALADDDGEAGEEEEGGGSGGGGGEGAAAGAGAGGPGRTMYLPPRAADPPKVRGRAGNASLVPDPRPRPTPLLLRRCWEGWDGNLDEGSNTPAVVARVCPFLVVHRGQRRVGTRAPAPVRLLPGPPRHRLRRRPPEARSWTSPW